jgi:hypothetical protein
VWRQLRARPERIGIEIEHGRNTPHHRHCDIIFDDPHASDPGTQGGHRFVDGLVHSFAFRDFDKG